MCTVLACCWPGMALCAHVSIAAGSRQQAVLVAPSQKRLLCIGQGQTCFRVPLWPVEVMRQAASVSLQVEGFWLGTSLRALASGASAGHAARGVCLRGSLGGAALVALTEAEVRSLKHGLQGGAAGRHLLCDSGHEFSVMYLPRNALR